MSLNYLWHKEKILNFVSLNISSYRSLSSKGSMGLFQMNPLLNIFKCLISFNVILL